MVERSQTVTGMTTANDAVYLVSGIECVDAPRGRMRPLTQTLIEGWEGWLYGRLCLAAILAGWRGPPSEFYSISQARFDGPARHDAGNT
jgi:hypothetical protein